MTLEGYVTFVRQLTSTRQFNELTDTVMKAVDQLCQSHLAAHLDQTIGMLDFRQHTIGLCGLLYAKFQSRSQNTDLEIVCIQVNEFVTHADEQQARHAAGLFCAVCHQFADFLADRKLALRGLSTIERAIQKVQSTPTQLTSLHSDLIMLCLASKCFAPALRVIQTDLLDVAAETFAGEVRYAVQFFYYAGCVHAALKQYGAAQSSFELALSVPAQALSSVQLESYKKWLLVALLAGGRSTRAPAAVPSAPKFITVLSQRYLRPAALAYHEIATAFAAYDAAALDAALAKHSETLARDRNVGLARQLIGALAKRAVARLTKTFVTLSLADVAQRCRLGSAADAERLLLEMVSAGQIRARISQRDGMVRFEGDSHVQSTRDDFATSSFTADDDANALAQIEKQMQRCMELEKKLSSLDNELAVNPQYVQRLLGMGKGGQGSAHDDDGAFGMGGSLLLGSVSRLLDSIPNEELFSLIVFVGV